MPIVLDIPVYIDVGILFNGLVEGHLCRTHPYFMGKSMEFCRFSMIFP